MAQDYWGEKEKSSQSSTVHAPMRDLGAHERDGLTRAGAVVASWSLGLRSYAALALCKNALEKIGP